MHAASVATTADRRAAPIRAHDIEHTRRRILNIAAVSAKQEAGAPSRVAFERSKNMREEKTIVTRIAGRQEATDVS
jgi:hypothetical protein